MPRQSGQALDYKGKREALTDHRQPFSFGLSPDTQARMGINRSVSTAATKTKRQAPESIEETVQTEGQSETTPRPR
jgi:hypothetical protein